MTSAELNEKKALETDAVEDLYIFVIGKIMFFGCLKKKRHYVFIYHILIIEAKMKG